MEKRKGFTLVEAMVVVVILGVLSAVAVPKLFGHIAKAKAAEVPVAAGSYTSLQDAFLIEFSSVGNWRNIGYAPPGTNGYSNYFRYSEGCITENIQSDAMPDNVIGWQAQNLTQLNDCTASSTWALSLSINSSSTRYRQLVSSNDCAALTAKWTTADINSAVCPTFKSTPESSTSEPASSTAGYSSGGSEGTSSPSSSSSGSSMPPQNEEESSSSSNSKTCTGKNGRTTEMVLTCKELLEPGYSGGVKNGWDFVEECDGFVNNAKNLGYDDATKKKDLDYASVCRDLLQQREDEKNSSSSVKSSASSSGSKSSASGSGSGSGGIPGGGGGGGTGGGNGSGTTPSSASTGGTSGTQISGGSSSPQPDFTITGDDSLTYEDLDDELCTELKGNGKCKNNATIPKSQCVTYDATLQLCTSWVD